METNNTQNQKGFTLVEIAIVLVIIGLLLGGVLKGQELITNSKIKSVASDFDGIATAYYAYRDRTGEVPGDSDKDGIIDETEAAGGFWSQLRGQGFIKGASSVISGPVHALDGNFSVLGGASGAMFIKNHICANKIEPIIAKGMDIKLDDGDATTGIIRAGTAIGTATSGAYSGTDVLFVCREL
ncbi:hypothetical protein MNBD_GAMMA03-1333 [hydrothermal vent metagenome]|uniref:Prepilin-type N-terminal cleavage/methylation domain-containing protein n=1 Tax=hydrothermal vent metagenome TaxID=652676 RepID=A0A3B0WDY3_9ZZZZ